MTIHPLNLDVQEQIECAQTLASRFYIDPAILEVEKQRIFRRTWQLVGTLNQSCGEVNGTQRTISDPESYFTIDVAGEPVIVQRGLRSSTYDRGRYSVKRENGVHHFHMLLNEFLGRP